MHFFEVSLNLLAYFLREMGEGVKSLYFCATVVYTMMLIIFLLMLEKLDFRRSEDTEKFVRAQRFIIDLSRLRVPECTLRHCSDFLEF